jgi:hypothetical protein
MHKSLVGLAAAAALGLAAVTAPAKADCIGCAVGAGILRRRRRRPTIIRRRRHPRPLFIRVRVQAMPRWRRAATGASVRFGLKVTATAGEPCKSVSEILPLGRLPPQVAL